MRSEHPLIVLTVEALAREFGVAPKALWDALDGKPTPRQLAERLVQSYYPGLRLADFSIEGLPSVPNDARIGTPMEAQTHSIVGAKPTDHEWTRVLRERGITITEAAHALGVTRSAAKSWILAAPHGRKIPRAHAIAISRKYGVPLSAWTHGIIAAEK